MDTRETPKEERSLPPWVMVCMDNLKAVKADKAKPNIASGTYGSRSVATI
jgi:hypothetical protein